MLNPDILSALQSLQQTKEAFYAALDSVRTEPQTGAPIRRIPQLQSVFDSFAKAHDAQLEAIAALAKADIVSRLRIE